LFEDADLAEAVPTAVRAAFRNQGQICLAGSRLYVQESVYEKVLAQVVELVKQIVVGDPNDKKTQMGAIISQEQYDKVQSYIEVGKKEGKLLTGGERPANMKKGFFLSPVVLAGLKNESRCCQE